ncbi:MAG TPA: HEAT repeat domain-containing protein [Pirellulales bacterium]|jgi:HEAT repeat protein
MDVARLSADLQNPNAAVRAAAAEKLAQAAEAVQPAAVALVAATADADDSVRQWATGALESLGPPLEPDAGKLAALLADPRLDVAYWAAMLLGRLQSAAAAWTPQLTTALTSHPETAVRERAAWALGEIGPPAASALSALAAAAKQPSPRLARLAVQAAAQISATNERG